MPTDGSHKMALVVSNGTFYEKPTSKRVQPSLQDPSSPPPSPYSSLSTGGNVKALTKISGKNVKSAFVLVIRKEQYITVWTYPRHSLVLC